MRRAAVLASSLLMVVGEACTSATPVTCDLDCGPRATCVVSSGIPSCLCTAADRTSCPAGPQKFSCVQLLQDDANCGACGNTCQLNETCLLGTCTCPLPILTIGDSGSFCGRPPNCDLCRKPSAGLACCGSSCADLEDDPQNCGGCGSDCGASGSCLGGRCQCSGTLIACPPESGIGSVCVDPATDPANCGNCGLFCPSLQTCAGGWCLCEVDAGATICVDDAGFWSCTSLGSDPLNCGACGTICQEGETCIDGGCNCFHGTQCADAGLACIDLTFVVDGGDPCDFTQCLFCATNAPPGEPTCCNGGCTDLGYDPFNCGACGNVCPAAEECTLGICTCVPSVTVVQCATDGGLVCVDLSKNPDGCRVPECGCDAGPGSICCGTSCFDATGDPFNCGACGNVCDSGVCLTTDAGGGVCG